MSKRKQETRRHQIRQRYLRRLKRKDALTKVAIAAKVEQQKSETVSGERSEIQQPA
ncbi:MAG: hypothetical protein V1833_07405 [Elusimicrobiota bacterium]